jgi:hypothetical protein
MAEKFEEVSRALLQEVARLESERRALETKIEVLRLTEAEITERIGDHMENLKVKMRLEELQRAAGKFAADLEARGV